MRNHRGLGVALIGAALAAACADAAAAQPRTRTLEYDADKHEWIEVPPPPPGTAEGDLYQIRVLLKQRDYRRALSAAKRFVDSYGMSDADYPDVIIAKAEALIGRRAYHKAYLVLENFLNEFAGTELTSEALRLEFVIAETYLSGVRRKLGPFRVLSGKEVAYQILDDISLNHPDERIAEYAIKTKADHLFREGEHGLAELEYGRLLRDYPGTQYERYAMRRTAEAALASFAGTDYDDAALIEAEERYGDYRARYGEIAERDDQVSQILAGIRERRAEKEYTVGAYYDRTGHLSSAVFYYETVASRWPDTVAAAKAQTRLALLGAAEPEAPSLRPQ